MAGPDAVRGITFQHAVAIQSCLDAMSDDRVASIRFEGSEDVLDLEALDESGHVLWAKQMKTRQEPRTWRRREIAEVIAAWFDTDPPENAEFSFVTDGQLGPSANELRQEIVAGYAGSQVDPTTIDELRAPNSEAIANLRLVTRAGTAGAILEAAEFQTLRLSKRTLAGPEAVSSRVDALFRLISTVSANKNANDRVVEMSKVLEILEIERPVAGAVEWEISTASAYINEIMTRPRSDDLAMLGLGEAQVSPESIRILRGRSAVDPEQGTPIELPALLHEELCFLVGGTGSGKSTSVELLESMAASASLVCIAISTDSYLPWRLDLAIRDRFEEILGRRVSNRLVGAVLGDPEVRLVIDGVTEISFDAQMALREELHEKRIEGLRCHVIVTGRDGNGCRYMLKPLGTAKAFRLLPLDHEQKLSLVRARSAELIESNSDRALNVVARVDHAIGTDSGDPLLFSMALSTWLSTEQFLSRSTLYEKFIEGFASLAGPRGEHVLDAVGLAGARLLASGSRQADRFSWASDLDEACTSLGFELSGSQILQLALDSGLLIRRSATGFIAPRHDSFADYLTGVAMSRGLVEWPDTSQHAWEEAIAFAAEISGFDKERGLLLCEQNPILAARLARFDVRQCVESPQSSTVEINELLGVLGGNNGVRLLPVACEFRSGGAMCELGAERVSQSLDIESHGVEGRHIVSIPDPVSPLHAAITLWASWLHAAVPRDREHRHQSPTSVSEAVFALRTYEESVTERIREVLTMFPKPVADRMAPNLLDRSLEARIRKIPGGRWGSHEFNVAYAWLEGSAAIREASEDDNDSSNLSGSSTLSFWIDRAPGQEAWTRVKGVINSLVRRRWL